MSVALIPVRVDGGLVVMHTRDEYERLLAGVDREAAALHNAPLDHPEPKENTDVQ